MNRRQKTILAEFITVIVITAVAVIAMIEFRNWVNRSEAMRAMEHLGRIVLQYRDEHGLVPPESWVDARRKNLPGYVRLGNLRYRARWIDIESDPNEFLAYTERKSHSLILKDGYLVLRLKEVLNRDVDIDVNVEWMDRQKFETLLAQQQSPLEIEMLRNAVRHPAE